MYPASFSFGHADELAVAVGVEVTHTGDEIVAVEGFTGAGNQVFGGDGRALGGDDGGCAGIEHLKDVRLFARAEGGDAGGQGFFVGALGDRRQAAGALSFVELLRNLVDDFAVAAAHAVPPGDVGGQRGGRGQRECDGRRRGLEHVPHPLRSSFRRDRYARGVTVKLRFCDGFVMPVTCLGIGVGRRCSRPRVRQIALRNHPGRIAGRSARPRARRPPPSCGRRRRARAGNRRRGCVPAPRA